MRAIATVALWVAVATTLFGQGADAQPPAPEPKTIQQKASYSIGLELGQMLKQDALDVSVEHVALGILHAITGKKPLLSEQQCADAQRAFYREMATKKEAQMKKVAETNQKQGEAFLAANKLKPGVVTLPSGLQYKIIKSGDGPSPQKTDSVRTHYHGTLIDGTVFDSSVQRNEPIEFPVGGVIRGWQEALPLMKVGDKWTLYVPSNLAYGDRGAGPVIGPNATLIFEVELLGIQ